MQSLTEQEQFAPFDSNKVVAFPLQAFLEHGGTLESSVGAREMARRDIWESLQQGFRRSVPISQAPSLRTFLRNAMTDSSLARFVTSVPPLDLLKHVVDGECRVDNSSERAIVLLSSLLLLWDDRESYASLSSWLALHLEETVGSHWRWKTGVPLSPSTPQLAAQYADQIYEFSLPQASVPMLKYNPTSNSLEIANTCRSIDFHSCPGPRAGQLVKFSHSDVERLWDWVEEIADDIFIECVSERWKINLLLARAMSTSYVGSLLRSSIAREYTGSDPQGSKATYYVLGSLNHIRQVQPESSRHVKDDLGVYFHQIFPVLWRDVFPGLAHPSPFDKHVTDYILTIPPNGDILIAPGHPRTTAHVARVHNSLGNPSLFRSDTGTRVPLGPQFSHQGHIAHEILAAALMRGE